MFKTQSPFLHTIRFALVASALALVAACAPLAQEAAPTPTLAPTQTPTPTPLPSSACELQAAIIPTPAEMPGYAQLDPSTGLHVTGTAPEIELDSYRLEVTGLVDHPLSLSYDDLRCMPRVEAKVTIVCPSLFSDTTTFAGVPLTYVLDMAGIQEEATQMTMTAGDGYSTTIALDVAIKANNFIAYEWNEEPLPILHGFPVRMVFPDLTGSRWVKWLVKLEITQ
jgi:DMSO/TMAO reductase YedYZ molybdopterin-dependent catalytic subunit